MFFGLFGKKAPENFDYEAAFEKNFTAGFDFGKVTYETKVFELVSENRRLTNENDLLRDYIEQLSKGKDNSHDGSCSTNHIQKDS